jgi:hypothetical protein
MTGIKKPIIRKILRNKIDHWLKSIEDETVRKVAAENVIVAGGAICNLLQGESPNDYDLYFKTMDATLTIAKYYAKKFIELREADGKCVQRHYKPVVQVTQRTNIRGENEDRVVVYIRSAGVVSEAEGEDYRYFETLPEEHTEDFIESLSSVDLDGNDPVQMAQALIKDKKQKKPMYRPVFLTENAISLSDNIQIVIRFFGNPDKIHDNYDYVHCMNYFDYHGNVLGLRQEAVEAILSKTLIYKGSLYPIASLFRIRKFIKRGWRITAGQMLKIIMQLNDIDLTDRDVFQEQLIGVDQAYMTQLLEAIQSTDNVTIIDTTYIIQLIDSIFEEI